MKKFLLLFLFCSLAGFVSAQSTHKSIMQEQSEEYSKYNLAAEQQWDSLNAILNPGSIQKIMPNQKSSCSLTKMVYGWYPYWNGTVYNNFQWNLISRLSYCFYDVDYSTGNATSTHSWSTAAVIDSAFAHGVKVDLCVDLFSNLTSFLGNTTAQTTLINNIVSMVQSRGAHGVCIDFEGMTSSNKTAFATFMTNLCNQMHASVPGSKVSIAAYAGGTSAFDIPTLNQYLDYFVIMGYDYYYGGSANAGSTDPLYSTGLCLTNTLTNYLNQGVTPSKLILGLPYYGFTWPVTGTGIHASTTGTGSSVLCKTVLTNASGYYSSPIWDSASYSPYYNYNNSGQYQAWVDNYYGNGERIDVVNQRGIGGIGIWALGYDDGYSGYWNNIADKLSDCSVVNCTDTIYDMGGPSCSYFNNENYTYTIAPTGATSVSLNFTSFSTEANYDTLKIYDGPSTASPLIGNYHGTNSPGLINSSSPSLTLKWKSDGATVASGWRAVWNCSVSVDNIPPTTTINATAPWQTQNFTANFTDADNVGGSGLEKSFFNVSDYDGSERHGSAVNGFCTDEFVTLDTAWKIPASSGAWSIYTDELLQSDTTVGNSNIYASLNQNLSNRYIYYFRAMLASSVYSTYQRRFGFHFYCDDASQTNRGNSYFIFFRQESSQLEFYKVVSNTYTLSKTVTGITTTFGQWYDYKIVFDRITGKIDVYRDDVFLGSWTDPSPLATAGNYISFRTGNAKVYFDDLEVFRSRNSSATITVGAALTNEIRFQNPNPSTPSGRIRSVCNDSIGNYSSIAEQDLNIDWTPPANITAVNDGTGSDVDTISNPSSISSNWSSSSDPNSGIAYYRYCFGTSPGASDLVGWTNNGLGTSVTNSSVSLTNGLTYYCSVTAANNAGLFSDTTFSDGQILAGTAVAGFYSSDTTICKGQIISYTNTSSNANSYYWIFSGGNPQYSTSTNPTVLYDTAGTFDVELHATGFSETDTLVKHQFIIVDPKANALFTAVDTLVFLSSANVIFTNTSTDATSYFWDFGDGSTSTDQNPWHTYGSAGYYTVTLIAYNSLCGNDTLVITNYIHVDSGVGINESSPAYDAEIFPTPATNEASLYITLASSDRLDISVLDMSGKTVYLISAGTLNNGTHKFIIDIRKLDLDNGAYFIRISGNRGNQYLRFIVE